MLINPIGTLRQLKGAPLSVLIALTIVKPRLVSSSWLAGCTGYATDAITSATWYLKELGFIDCDSHRTNWRLVGDVQQLPLPMSMLNPEPENPDPEKPDPDPPTTTTTLIDREKIIEVEVEALRNPNPEKPESDFHPSPRNVCRDLLYFTGIGEPMATKICDMDHVTPEYLDAHIQKANKDEIDIALLIHRIRAKDPMPKDRPSGYDRYRDDPWLCNDCYCRPCTCDDEEEEEKEEDI